MEIWHIWMIVAVVLFILEIFTPSFFFACIGVGCAVAGLCALVCSDCMVLQWSLFAAGTLLSFILIRPFILKYAYRKSEKVKTNADGLIGKTGRVTEAINSAAGTGRVSVGGDDWRAKSSNLQTIDGGKSVKVLSIEGVTLTVEVVGD